MANDEWEFKVDITEKTKTRKKTTDPKPRKKNSLEDIAKAFSEEEVELKLDTDKFVHRDKRNAMVKKSLALEEFARIKPAPLFRRMKASVVDVIFVATICGGTWMSYPFWKIYLETNLPPGLLGGFSHPEKVLEFSVVALVYIFFYLLPTCTRRKSLGKKLFDLRVGHREDDRPLSKKAMLWREVIVKPLSVLSLVGLLIALINENRRTLHDYLSGTTVYDEL